VILYYSTWCCQLLSKFGTNLFACILIIWISPHFLSWFVSAQLIRQEVRNCFVVSCLFSMVVFSWWCVFAIVSGNWCKFWSLVSSITVWLLIWLANCVYLTRSYKRTMICKIIINSNLANKDIVKFTMCIFNEFRIGSLKPLSIESIWSQIAYWRL